MKDDNKLTLQKYKEYKEKRMKTDKEFAKKMKLKEKKIYKTS